MRNPLLFAGLAAIIAFHSTAVSAAKPSTEKEKFSYAIGFQIGQGFKRDGLEVDTAALSQAIDNVLSNKEPLLSMAEMQAAMEGAQKKMLAKRAAEGEKAKAAGKAFLAANKKKKGVKTLKSGLQYKVISMGKGKQPTANSTVTAHYKGSLVNGREFDNSYLRNKPATFNLSQVIPGWKEVLPMMHEGDKWQVFIPADLAYGERGQGNAIGPNETLIFDIELIKVN